MCINAGRGAVTALEGTVVAALIQPALVSKHAPITKISMDNEAFIYLLSSRAILRR
jgi:hypothetical protein